MKLRFIGSLHARLIASMLIVPIIIAVLIAYMGYKQSEDSKKRLDYFILTSVPSIELLERIRYSAARHDAMLNKAVLMAKEARYLMDQIEEMESGLEILQEKFTNEYIADEHDRRLTEEDKRLLSAYLESASGVVKKINAGDTEGAKQLVTREEWDAYSKLDVALKAHVNYATKLAAKFQEEGKASAEANLLVQLSSAIGAVVVLGVLGYLNSSSIVKTLGGEPAEAAAAVKMIAERDLSQPIHARYPNSLITELEGMRQNLGASIQKLNEDTHKLTLYAESLASASHEVASGANVGSDNATRMAASAEEMTISIANVSESAQTVSQKVSESGEIAIRGGASIMSLTQSIAAFSSSFKSSMTATLSLGQQSDEIKSIVGEIKDIAEQTNLLALNAAIEAARAGDSGRGFAVVADEVRKLAERTKNSTEDIAAKIQAIQNNVQAVVAAMNQNLEEVARGESMADKADVAVREIRSASENTVALVSEISQVIASNSTASKEVAKSVENFASLSEENSAAAKEVAITASELSKLADSLSQVTSSFKTS